MSSPCLVLLGFQRSEMGSGHLPLFGGSIVHADFQVKGTDILSKVKPAPNVPVTNIRRKRAICIKPAAHAFQAAASAKRQIANTGLPTDLVVYAQSEFSHTYLDC